MAAKRKPSARRALTDTFRITTPDAPLDSSQVEDRRPRSRGDAGGGKIPYTPDGRGSLGMRPRDPKYVLGDRGAIHVERTLSGATGQATHGATKMKYPPRKKKLPWGLTMPAKSRGK